MAFNSNVSFRFLSLLAPESPLFLPPEDPLSEHLLYKYHCRHTETRLPAPTTHLPPIAARHGPGGLETRKKAELVHATRVKGELNL